MPYTPPANRSPASSASASPDVSRRSSIQSSPRPSLPRSASYLSKHRRTPSITVVSDGSASPLTPQGTEEDLPSMATNSSSGVHSLSLRKSPPPITGNSGMPNGAIISPPDSASSGSDDEGIQLRGRKADQLKDLRAAVSQIPQIRTPSPVARKNHAQNQSPNNLAPIRTSFSTAALSDMPKVTRAVSHSRSMTEPNASAMKSSEPSIDGSEDDTDEDLSKKPQMVRKKSGELVPSALRPSSRRRPSSMPGTPSFSKAVHFDSHLEHVRHFLQVDRPLAVSATSSPAEAYESDTEYPFDKEDRSAARSPPFEWEIQTSNFPHDSHHRVHMPVRMERVWLSTDQKALMGSVAVANIAFHKHVVCRFTLDYWKTTSEVKAEYSHEIRPKETESGNDRFTFNIKLSDTANLEAKTLFFCIRYTVDGQEFWDNNGMCNFQVDFKKKHLPQNGKRHFQGAAGRSANGLPKSNRRQSPATVSRPKSMPSGFAEFDTDPKFNFDQPLHEYLGESENIGLRLKTKSNTNLGSDNLAKGLTSPVGAAFSNRYDFGASLTAAVQATKDTYTKEKDTLYMKDHVRGSAPDFKLNMPPSNNRPSPLSASPIATGSSSPTVGLPPSSSYEELVNKYCFFGNKPSTLARLDYSATEAVNIVNTSPVLSPMYQTGSATHHSIHLHDSNPYFTGVVYNNHQISSPLRHATSAMSSQASTPNVVTTMRSASPGFPMGSSDEVPMHASSQGLNERFPWTSDSQTPQVS